VTGYMIRSTNGKNMFGPLEESAGKHLLPGLTPWTSSAYRDAAGGATRVLSA
jgi:hypothetical protein